MSEPRSLRMLLSAWRPAGERTPPGGETGALSAVWPDAVGADVARRTRTSTFRDGTLTVITPSSAWSHQLTFLAPTIIERLQTLCPGVVLRRLRFVVATGRSRTLLAGMKGARAVPRDRASTDVRSRPQKPGTADNGLDAPGDSGDDLESLLSRLRAQQQSLDSQRSREGFVHCVSCGRWSQTQRCEPCTQEARRADDARIASAIAGTPWLQWRQQAVHLPDADQKSFERVRRSLLAIWQQQLFNARARLRRGALEAPDRVIAWSTAMLVAQRRKEEISDAMLANVLGREWADALKAPRPAREK